MKGKQYLLTLTALQFPVIPTIDNVGSLKDLPSAEKYIIKPKEGADSIGARIVRKEEVETAATPEDIIQPFIDFDYEVSFYFIDAVFQYALYAPNKSERWKLESYLPSEADLAFAEKFVEWNKMSHGIQRVDACRTKEGNLLLVELEDLNPYLSLDLVDNETRNIFIANFRHALLRAVEN